MPWWNAFRAGDCRGPDRPLSGDGDKDVMALVHAARAHRLGLGLAPARLMETREDRIAEHLAQRLEDRFPGSQRELDDRVEVGLLERTDENVAGHGS